ncbi:MAG: NACHT domain-containing protein, partial [Cyanobacteria bacterium P01_F01_bin.143]
MNERSHQVLEQYLDEVRQARRLKNITQKTIAQRLGCTRQPISKFFNGKPVSCELFVEICGIIDVDWQEVAGLNEGSFDNTDLTELEENVQTTEIDIAVLVNKLRKQVRRDIENRCGTMRILDMSQPIGLGKIYTQVNILEKILGRRRKDIGELITSCSLEDFDRFNFGKVAEAKMPGKEAVAKYSKLMILGKPGAGKTTFLKHLVIQSIRGLFQGEFVPFFISLKEFAETEDKPSLFDYLGQYIYNQDREDLQEIFKQGKALICLDGLDEVLEVDSQRVIREIESLTNQFPDNQYLMTCRIAAREYTFGQFTEVEIADFDWKQITSFANNWFKNKLIKAETFLKQLDKEKPIKELVSSPLLLTLLCISFEELGDFPANRKELYEEGLDTLLKKWDAKRGIKRDKVYKPLSVAKKEDLLSKIAWKSFEPGEYFFKQDQAKRYISEYIRNLPGASLDDEALQGDSG